MRKASTRLPEQGTQTPSPAPDLIPAETENQPRTHTETGTANGGTSVGCSLRARRTHTKVSNDARYFVVQILVLQSL
jgi:hypothetical protein